MKPFNLQEAIAGKPVVTRQGKMVTNVTTFPLTGIYPVVALIKGETSVSEYTIEGRYFAEEGRDSNNDLFMAATKKTVYVNIYRDDPDSHFFTHNGEVAVGNCMFNTLREAREVAEVDALKTIAIEYEL